jgi:hypothetical protein
MSGVNPLKVTPPSLRDVSSLSLESKNLPILQSGEIVAAEIVRNGPGHKVLVSLKNQRLWAESEVPLKAGDVLTVRVEQTQPKVILRIWERALAGISKVDECLRTYRSNPNALLNMITMAASVLDDGRLAHTLRTTIRNILDVIHTLVLSEKTAGNPRFLRDYIANLGLTLESSLTKLSKRADRDAVAGPRTLKGLLMKLSGEIGDTRGVAASQTPEAMAALDRLAQFCDESISAIEAEQTLNIQSWEKENKFMVSIPLNFPGGMRSGDVLIYGDKNHRHGGEKGENIKTVLLLDMDALGELVIDAGMKAKKVTCHIQCENEELESFISQYLGELAEGFRTVGMEVDWLDCTVAENLSQKRQHVLMEKVSSAQEEVNLFA